MSGAPAVLLGVLMLGGAARAQRPDENALFGAPDAGLASGDAARPSEESVFGGSDGGSVSGTAQPGENPPGSGSSEAAGLDRTPSPDAFATGEVKEDPLKIGGLFYTRAFMTVSQDQPFNQSRVSAPTLVDVYLDARPTDQLRAFVLGRMTYDPFLATTVGGTALPGTVATTTASNPAVELDQAWLSFDIAHAVFVTAGRQHVKWGVARFFSPTDFLASQPRDPFAVFDARLGVTMLRAQVPWEKMGWNFTAVALFEPTQNVGGSYSGSGSVQNPGGSGVNPAASGTELRDIGGALRAEFAFKNGAFGIDGLAQRNRKSRLGADLTMSLGDFDIYGEAAVKDGLDTPTQSTVNISSQVAVPSLGPCTPGSTCVTVTTPVTFSVAPRSTPVVQAAGGATYSFNIEGNKSLTLGGEYFYNSASYDRSEYLNLLLVGGFQPFYVGKHYLALSATWVDSTAKTTWVLSGIGNLSDGTYIARVDFLITVLRYLSVEAFVAGHFGRSGGELRLAFPQQTVEGQTFGPLNAPLVDVGVGLRLSL
jgi:hypothetical protein